MEILVILSGFCKEKTNPNKANITVHGYLFIVHSKDNERQFEKTNPISGCLSVNSCLESKSIFETIVLCMASRIFRIHENGIDIAGIEISTFCVVKCTEPVTTVGA
jgi:hypothetical protein